MSALRHAIFENPFLKDRSYLLRRLLGGSHTGRRTLFYVLAGVVLMFLVGLAGAFPNWMTPRAILFTQSFLIAILVPVLLYPSIAAEREKRSWDLLRVCPLSDAQIVLGKYLVAMLFVVFVASFFLIPSAVSELAAATQFQYSYSYYEGDKLNFGQFVAAEAYSLAFAAGVGALSVWISARAKRGFSAMLTILALLTLLLLFLPILLSSFGIEPGAVLIGYCWHPFVVINMIGRVDQWEDYTPYGSTQTAPEPVAWAGSLTLGIIMWLVFTGLFLWLACISLKTDEDRIQTPSKSNA